MNLTPEQQVVVRKAISEKTFRLMIAAFGEEIEGLTAILMIGNIENGVSVELGSPHGAPRARRDAVQMLARAIVNFMAENPDEAAGLAKLAQETLSTWPT